MSIQPKTITPPLQTPPIQTAKGLGDHSFSKPWSDFFAITVTPTLQKVQQPQLGTHAQRLAHPLRISSSAQLFPTSTVWRESDRGVFYIVFGGLWYYLAGTMFGLAAARPADLVATDAGFQFYATDTNTFSMWIGTAWVNP